MIGATNCAFSEDRRYLYLGSSSPLSIINKVSAKPIYALAAGNNNDAYLGMYDLGITYSPSSNGWFSVFDNKELVNMVPLPPQLSYGTMIPQAIIFTPSRKSIYIAAEDKKHKFYGLLQVNPRNNQFVKYHHGIFKNTAFATDWLAYTTHTMYYKNNEAGVYLWDLSKNLMVDHFPIPTLPDESDIIKIKGIEVLPNQNNKQIDTMILLKEHKLFFIKHKRPDPVNLPVVTNAASFYLRPATPGGIATIFGENLSNTTAIAEKTPLPTELGKTQVKIGNYLAPLFYVSPTQINLQIPFEINWSDGKIKVKIVPDIDHPEDYLTIINQADYSDVGIFSAKIEGVWQPIIVNASRQPWEFVTPSNPVMPSEWITIYLTGLGRVSPPVPTGEAAPMSPLSVITEKLEVTINKEQAETNFAGLTPGFAGLYQINIKIPDLLPGAHIVKIRVGAREEFLILYTKTPSQ